MGSGVQPRRTSPHDTYMKFVALQILPVDVSNFKFATRRWLEIFSNLNHLTVIKIKSCHRVPRFRMLRLLFNAKRLPLRIEFNDAVAFWIMNRVSKHASPFRLQGSFAQFLDEVVPIKNIVTQDKRASAGPDKSLRN